MAEFQTEAAGHLSGLTSLLEEFRSISSSSHSSGTDRGAQAHQDGNEITLTSSSCVAAAVDIDSRYEVGLVEDRSSNIPQRSEFELPFASSQEDSLMSRLHENDTLTFVCDGPALALDRGELQLPSEHIQCAGQSLPSLATELVTAQSSQVNEVQRRKALLTKLETELDKGTSIMLYFSAGL